MDGGNLRLVRREAESMDSVERNNEPLFQELSLEEMTLVAGGTFMASQAASSA